MQHDWPQPNKSNNLHKKVLLSIKTFISMNSSRDIIPNSEIRYFESWSMSQLERAAICSG